MRRNLGRGLFLTAILVPSNQLVEVITVRTVGAETVFVEETLDAAARTDLVGMALGPHRPTHPRVPAAAKDYDCSPCQPGRH